MDEDIHEINKRLAQAQTIGKFLPSDYQIIGAISRFPHPIIAHPELGLCALIIYDGIALYDEEDNRWYGTDSPLDPSILIEEARQRLAILAKGQAKSPPFDRVTALMWLPHAYTLIELEGITTSTEPMLVAQAIENRMLLQLQHVETRMSDWFNDFVSTLTSKKTTSPNEQLKKISSLILENLKILFKDKNLILLNAIIKAEDMADPLILLPVLLTIANEDWSVTQFARNNGLRLRSRNHPGFVVYLAQDPTTIFGYRVESILASTQYLIQAPIIATLKRFEYKKQEDEFIFDEMIEQFARFLVKNNLDSSVCDDLITKFDMMGEE